MTPSSCPWRTRALGPSPAGSPASGRCTSNAGRGSRRPTRTSSPGCATRTWRTMRKEPRCLRSQMGESTPGQGQGFWPNILGPQLPVVLQYHQQQHPALLQCLLQLDSAPFDPEEPQGSAGLLPAAAAGVGPHQGADKSLSLQTCPRACQGPCSENSLASCPGTFSSVLILVGVGLEVAPSPGVSSAIFFVPGFLLLVPGVYHVIFIYCAVKGHRGFQFFYLPYFEK
ncbi:transmembrane protein 134 isoform X2 [Eptesicus fuscus]|uniref:transmembrane protein 134 isoform X2 n=1 Tax=Eptesicus fuscus TaxID=29078 RepID=UPI002403D12C|nr:transmembrane protein 134 isoform X2 [Eptesicus fuscus]